MWHVACGMWHAGHVRARLLHVVRGYDRSPRGRGGDGWLRAIRRRDAPLSSRHTCSSLPCLSPHTVWLERMVTVVAMWLKPLDQTAQKWMFV